MKKLIFLLLISSLFGESCSNEEMMARLEKIRFSCGIVMKPDLLCAAYHRFSGALASYQINRNLFSYNAALNGFIGELKRIAKNDNNEKNKKLASDFLECEI